MGEIPASVQARVHELLEPAVPGDVVSRIVDGALVAFIVANGLAGVLHSVPEIAAGHRRLFELFELASVAVFVGEYGIRLWSAAASPVMIGRSATAARMRYVVSLEGLVDLLAFTPFIFVLAVPVEPHLASVLPLLRVLKLIRYSPAITTLSTVVYNERRTLMASATIMLVLLLFSSSLIFLVERTAQPDVFTSIPGAMWWGIATLTTVGYGDITPVTPLGRFLGAIVTVLGVAMFALPAAILATGFAQEIKEREFLLTWNLVAGVPFFRGLKAVEIARITRLLVPQVAQPGQVVVRKGDRADCMFFVVSGDLEVDLGDRRIRFEGDFFGEIALLTQGTRSATVRAVSRVQLLLLHVKHFHTFLQHHPELAETINRTAHERLAADSGRASAPSPGGTG